jgi:hypothetical protein
MARVRRIVNEEDLKRYFRSISSVESLIKEISQEDTQEIGDQAVTYIRDIFPKASGSRNTFFPEGSKTAQNRGTPLFRGWRTYTISENGNIGVRVQHARIGNENIRAILASLDQGSKAYTIYLRRGDFFRFMGADGKKVIVRGKSGQPGIIRIPTRPALPTPLGYIKPTVAYVQELIEVLRSSRSEDIADSYTHARKVSRRELIRARYNSQKVNRIISNA